MNKEEMAKNVRDIIQQNSNLYRDNWIWGDYYEKLSEACGIIVEKPEGSSGRNSRNTVRQRFAKTIRRIIPYKEYTTLKALQAAPQIVDAILLFHNISDVQNQNSAACDEYTENDIIKSSKEEHWKKVIPFLQQGKAGKWAWETCVEEVAKDMGFDYTGDNVEAVMKASWALCQRYPGGRKKGSDIWERMDIVTEAQFIANSVKSTFQSVMADLTPEYSETSLRTMKDRSSL